MSPTKRIAFIGPRFPEAGTVGGAETLLKNLAVRCAAAGHTVDFLTTCATNHFTWENDRPAGSKQVDGLTVHFYPVDEDRDVETFLRIQANIGQGGGVARADEETWIRNSVNSRALLDHLSRHLPDYDALLVGPYLFGLTYQVATSFPEKTRLVPCLHDECFAYLSIMHDMFHAVRGSLFNTRPEQQLAERLYDLPANGSSVVGMGLDPFKVEDQVQAAFRQAHDLTQPYLLYSGRRETLKGTPVLTHFLNTFRQRTQRDVRLVCTGSGDIEAPDALLPFLTDLGFVSEQDKHAAMAGCLAFCHPGAYESLGIVLLETWLAGRPGLVTAASEVLVDQCRSSKAGLWFRNYPEFERELLLLLDQPELADAMGQAGQAYVQQEYSWDAVEKRLFAALEE